MLVALGSAIGGVARHLVTIGTARLVTASFPWATLGINILGSFLIGFIAARPTVSPEARLFFMTGVLGGFTTFSAFSLQTVELWKAGQGTSAGAYVIVSVAGSVLGCALGWMTRAHTQG